MSEPSGIRPFRMPLGWVRAQGPVTLDDVRLDEVDEFATSLPGVRRKGHPGRVAWYVDDRLVVREDLPGTLLVRVPMAEREDLLERHPETFGVPPRWEAHHKLQADLAGDAGAIRDAIRRAWAMQRRGQDPAGGSAAEDSL